MKPSSLRTHWEKARRAAGRKDLPWHGLRHTGNTLAGQAGATDAELMARADHGSKAAVQIYQRSTLDRDRRIAKRMSRLAGEKVKKEKAKQRTPSQRDLAPVL